MRGTEVLEVNRGLLLVEERSLESHKYIFTLIALGAHVHCLYLVSMKSRIHISKNIVVSVPMLERDMR